MSERYGVTTLDELAMPAIPGQARWHTVRRTLGVSAFGVNAWTATEDGGQIIGEHEEASGEAHEELYIVVTGHATFTLDGEEVAAPAGTLVHVADPAVKRGAVGEEGTTIIVVGAKPGEAFTPSTWERASEALQFWRTRTGTGRSRCSSGTWPRRPSTRERTTTWRARTRGPVVPTSRSGTRARRSSYRRASRSTRRRTTTSSRSATSSERS